MSGNRYPIIVSFQPSKVDFFLNILYVHTYIEGTTLTLLVMHLYNNF